MSTDDETGRLIMVVTEELMKLKPTRTEPRLSPHIEIADLGLDSVDTMELLTRLEDRESATIPESALGHLRTVADIVDLLRQYRDQ